jgi:peptide subunit release factor 1 (eRF1)
MNARSALDHVRSLVERPGPFVSLYLDTQAASESGTEQLELRWRSLREQASAEDAGDDALAALDQVVHGSHRRGHGLAAFAAGSSVAFRRHLSAPIDDLVAVGPLPHLVPLLDWAQDHPRYAVVLADRTGAEIHVVGGHSDDETVSVEGDDDPIRKVQPGGWSQRRYQARAENTWEANAKQVADELASITRSERIDFVILAGDVRAIAFLNDNLVQEVESIAFQMDTEPHSVDDIKDELEAAAAAYTARTTKALVERFNEERGQRDLAVEGAEATLEALRMGQVETLLLSSGSGAGPAWFSASDLTQVASTKATLTGVGLDDLQETPLVDVLLRAALGTGAGIRILPALPQDELPAQGVGAILRYTV